MHKIGPFHASKIIGSLGWLLVSIGCSSETTKNAAGQPDPSLDEQNDTAGNGTSGDSSADDTAGDTGKSPFSVEDYRLTGPFEVETTTQSVDVGSCSMSHTLYSPQGDATGPLVLLSHGFVRSQNNMVGWAEHYASWGFTVATPDLCHASLLDADHSTNADDLIDLGQALDDGGVIYAGQSAGGLASLLAASRDANALGVLGLDATDSDTLGVSEANGIAGIVYGLAGEPSDCNASNNGLDIYAQIEGARVLRVTEADHCDFESDTDALCTTFCEGTNAQFSDEEIREAIIGLSTAALFGAMGNTAAGEAWWVEGGQYYAELQENGLTSVP